MTDFRSAASLGARIQAARKARGMSARELAVAIGGVPSQATIENIELGRKAAVDVVHLLNIAMALRVPPSYLLAPMGNPDDVLDLPGLSQDFDRMTAIEFDSWLSSAADDLYRPKSIEERNAVNELQALRAWKSQLTEVARLETALELERQSSVEHEAGYLRATEHRLADARKEASRLQAFLSSAGWRV